MYAFYKAFCIHVIHPFQLSSPSMIFIGNQICHPRKIRWLLIGTMKLNFHLKSELYYNSRKWLKRVPNKHMQHWQGQTPSRKFHKHKELFYMNSILRCNKKPSCWLYINRQTKKEHGNRNFSRHNDEPRKTESVENSAHHIHRSGQK